MTNLAKEAGVSRQTVYRIKDDMAGAEAMLERWERSVAVLARFNSSKRS